MSCAVSAAAVACSVNHTQNIIPVGPDAARLYWMHRADRIMHIYLPAFLQERFDLRFYLGSYSVFFRRAVNRMVSCFHRAFLPLVELPCTMNASDYSKNKKK